MSPGMHFNSPICPIFLCSCCLDNCGTLHIFTLEVHGEGGHAHVHVPPSQAPGFAILPNEMGTGRLGLPSLVAAVLGSQNGDQWRDCEIAQHLLLNRAVRSASASPNGAEKQLTLIKLAEICAPLCMCVVLAKAVGEDLFWLVLIAAGEKPRPISAPGPRAFIPDVTVVKLMGAIPATRQLLESWRRLLCKSD